MGTGAMNFVRDLDEVKLVQVGKSSDQMSYSLNSLKGLYRGFSRGLR